METTQLTDLELSIFRTICWFSLFEFPLTHFEIWKWLLKPHRAYDLFEVSQSLLQSRWLHDRLQTTNGFYSMKIGRTQQDCLAQRHVRFLDGVRKYRKLRSACHFFQLLPSVRAVAAANTLSWWHTTEKSDIDLYVVTHPKKIWSTRLFLVFPFLLTGNRPAEETDDRKDPFCFSFFSTTNALQLESLKWDAEDYYLAFWVKSLVPMLDRSSVFAEVSALNRWADVLLPNARPRTVHPVHKPKRVFSLPIQHGIFEPLFRTIQKKKFPASLRELANRDSRVVITDEMLKFHDNDRRAQFSAQFQEVFEKGLVL